MAIPQFNQPSAGDFRWFMSNRPLVMMGCDSSNQYIFPPVAPGIQVNFLPQVAAGGMFDRYGVVDLTSSVPTARFDFSYPVGLCENGYYLINATAEFAASGAVGTTVTGTVGTYRNLSVLFNASVVYTGTTPQNLDCYYLASTSGWATNGNGGGGTNLLAVSALWAPSVVIHVTKPSDIVNLRLTYDCNSVATSGLTSYGYAGTQGATLALEFLGI
jgi:hypothetical protein